eukprot:CAMPEP_0170195798 /NCGR_PEP_ID=MMETSP0040_2-20121228/62226_1 /TAXON_ID=641309 /ORGANISM="Lotharella oceanica, Strain CCMP622" /LENGTH=345 /DNA_ID=CAMNT_0010445041 /DNA_START=401 /DNA_END=1435 /DNA_ORIENTATION=-
MRNTSQKGGRRDSKMALALDDNPSQLVRNDKTRAGAISGWMTDSKDDFNKRALSRLPTSIKQGITRDSWWRKIFCCCCRNSDETTVKELQDALKGLNLSLYELEYLNMTTSFTEPEIVLLAKQYHHLDLNKDGVVSSDELTRLPEFRRNPLKERLKEYFEAQNDGQTKFSMRQFITTLSVFSPRASIAEKCRFLFNVYDCDGDGKIGKEDLRKILDMTLISKMDNAEIEAVVARTFEECAGDEAMRLVRRRRNEPESHEYITFQSFSHILSNTNVGSKVSIDLERLARTKQLTRMKTTKKRFPPVNKKKKKKGKKDKEEEDDMLFEPGSDDPMDALDKEDRKKKG